MGKFITCKSCKSYWEVPDEYKKPLKIICFACMAEQEAKAKRKGDKTK